MSNRFILLSPWTKYTNVFKASPVIVQVSFSISSKNLTVIW